MKKILIAFISVMLLCMLFTVSVFADELDPEADSGIDIQLLDVSYSGLQLPDNAVLVDSGNYMKAGRTYYIAWIVRSDVDNLTTLGTFNDRTNAFLFFKSIPNDSYTASVNQWLYKAESTTFMHDKLYPMVTANSSYDRWNIKYPTISAADAEVNVYYVASMTLPANYESNRYSLNNPSGSDMIYFYFLCDHVYDNSCDADCNECGTEREITHTYPDDNDHNCSVCAYANPEPTHVYLKYNNHVCSQCTYANPEPTHVYVDGNNHVCSQCAYTNPEPTHIYDNDDDLICNYCDHERPKPSIWNALAGISSFVIAIVVEFAMAITKNPLLLLAIVGIPCVGLGVGILSRLFGQRV